MDIKGAEILAVGTWNRTTFTLDDLNSIVSAFNALGDAGRIPLKLGHEADDTGQADQLRDGAPSLGWVTKLWVEGKKLFANFSDVPEKLVNVIQKGMYKFVSVELLRDVKAGTSQLPWVLDAVSILGATRPAVGILKDLQSLVLARRTEFQFRARLTMSRDKFIFSEGKEMDEQQVQALIAAALNKQATETSQKFSDLEKANKERVEAVEKENLKLRRDGHRAAINAMFETPIQAGTLEPKHREMFKKMSNFDKDDSVLSIELSAVTDYIKEHSKAPTARTGTTKSTFAADNESPEMDVTEAMCARINKLAAERGLDSSKFETRIQLSTEILRSDKSFAAVYNMGPGHTLKEVA